MTSTIINKHAPRTFPSYQEAHDVATKMNEMESVDGMGWSYDVEPTVNGRFFIVAFDEDGFNLGPV